MSSSGPPTRPPTHTNEEILEAVQKACRAHNAPVAKTEWVADRLEIKQEQTANNLDDLAGEGRIRKIGISRGSVWWVPEEESVAIRASDLSTEAEDWDFVVPEALSEDVVERIVESHPEVDSPSQWEQRKSDGQLIARVAVPVSVVGLGLLFINDTTNLISLGTTASAFLVIIMFGGLIFMMLGIGVMTLAWAGGRVSDTKTGERLSQRIESAKQFIGRNGE